ncbi:MAG: hypothetical protein LBR06_07580 [Bacteroidales bacterium]|jgi:hypothetical protein|nr:hypothetical protein [Bacteroidales bacterium]
MFRIISITLVSSALVGCYCEVGGDCFNGGNTVTASLCIRISADMAEHSAQMSAITTIDTSLYDLRYIAEVWTRSVRPKLVAREYRIASGMFASRSVLFEMNLPKGRYDIILWADFVYDGADEQTARYADLYYGTNSGKTAAEIAADPTCDSGLYGIIPKTVPDTDPHSAVREAFYRKFALDVQRNIHRTLILGCSGAHHDIFVNK